MFSFKRLLFVTLYLSTPIYAQESASWLRQRVANALNPKISVIGDFVYQTGPKMTTDQFSLREVEIAVQSEIDSNARADFFFAYHDDNFELEEGYITVLTLPLGLQGRAGKFLTTFGKLNYIHSPELPQVDRPLVLESFFGEEGIRDTGLEISRVFAPFQTFTEISYGFLNGLGKDHNEETATTTVTDTNGNTVRVVVNVPEVETSKGHLRDFAHVGRLRLFRDFTDSTNIDLGFSGALHQPKVGEQKKFGGIDLTFRWKPTDNLKRQGFIWRTEFVTSSKKLHEETDPITGAVTEPEAKVNSAGGYSYAEIQINKLIGVGTRGDYVEDSEARERLLVTRAVSPYITFYLNEFNRFRTQYTYKDIPGTQDEHIGYAQWTITIGPHGAHQY